MTARRVLLVGIVLLVLAVGAVLAAAALIPTERVAAAVAARAEAVLGQPVEIAEVRVRVLPLPGVRITGARVGPADSTAIAAADAVELRVRIFPLFRGRVVVDRLALDRPRVFLSIDSAGVSNLPALFGDSAAAEADAGARRDIAFAIDRIQVDGGRIAYLDARDGTAVRLDGWSQSLRLSGSLRGGELAEVALEGSLAFDDVDTRLPGIVIPARDLSVRVEHDATLDRTADRLVLDRLQVALAGVALAGSGTIEALSDPERRTAALQLSADGLDAAELLAWAPESLRARLALPDGRRIDVTGSAALDVTIDGPLAADTLPPFHGTLRIADAGAALGGESLLANLGGQAMFGADSVVGRLTGASLGTPFHADFALRDARAPILTVALAGGLPLDRLARLGLVADSLGLTGGVAADLRLRLPLRDLPGARADGTVQLQDLRVPGASLGIAIPRATLRLAGDSLRAAPIPLRLGDDAVPIDLEVAAAGWIPALVDSAAPPARVSARLQAAELDLDRLLGPSESQYPPLLFARLRNRAIDGRSAAEVASEAGLALPALPPVDADIHARIGRLVRNEMTYTDVELRARSTPAALEVTELRLGMLGGTLVGHGRFEPTETDSTGRPTQALVRGEYTIENVGAAQFFDRLTPFRDHLSGELALAGTVDLALDSTALPDPSALRAGGAIALAEGRLANWRVLQALAGRLGLTAYDTVQFHDWAGSFGITGTLVTLDETMLSGRDLDARAAGSFDLGGALDLGATLSLAPELAARAGEVGRQAAAVAGTDGRIPVGVRIGGTMEDPDVSLDFSEARDNVVARAREAAQEEARQIGEQVARETLQRLDLPDSLLALPPDSLRRVVGDSLFELIPDSARIRGDSLRARAEDALRDRLRRLLPRPGGRDTVP